MASIKFFIQSKSNPANIYVRFSLNRQTVLRRKTGYTINPSDWSIKKGFPIQKNEDLKALKFKLDDFALKLQKLHNKATENGEDIDGNWLQKQIDTINNNQPVLELDILTNYIQHIIKTSSSRLNQKGGLGLSERRKKGYVTFLNTIKKYEFEYLKGKSILIKDVDLNFTKEFQNWLFEKKYSINYVGKNIDNLKAVCNDAFKHDIETSKQLVKIKSFSEAKEPDSIIYLSEAELEKISEIKLNREALINARKWLLLGCSIGQRGNDLLSITKKNIKEIKGMNIIELKQGKTGKLVAIPLLPNSQKIISEGFPYSISLQKFNEYIKAICRIAEIDTPTKGLKRQKQKINDIKAAANVRLPGVKGVYPKHELIGSHVCRRSFATNFYGKIPTPILINITGHSTERMFLKYIGKTTYENAYQMVEYFSKLDAQKLIKI